MRKLKTVFAIFCALSATAALAQSSWPAATAEYRYASKRVSPHVFEFAGTVNQPASNIAGTSASSAVFTFDPSLGDASSDAVVELYACQSDTTDKTRCRAIAAPVPPDRIIEASLGVSELFWRLVVVSATTGGDIARATLTVTEPEIYQEATLE